MGKPFLSWLHRIVSDARKAIIGVIVLALLFVLGVSILGWPNYIGEILKYHIPLWLSCVSSFGLLLFVLFVLWYKDEKTKKEQLCQPVEDLITVGLFKWKVLHNNGQVLKIYGFPYCIEHECLFIPRDNDWVCPISGCKSILSNYDFNKVKVAASNVIENFISSKKESPLL
jgi:hypothetical protein